MSSRILLGGSFPSLGSFLHQMHWLVFSWPRRVPSADLWNSLSVRLSPLQQAALASLDSRLDPLSSGKLPVPTRCTVVWKWLSRWWLTSSVSCPLGSLCFVAWDPASWEGFSLYVLPFLLVSSGRVKFCLCYSLLVGSRNPLLGFYIMISSIVLFTF